MMCESSSSSSSSLSSSSSDKPSSLSSSGDSPGVEWGYCMRRDMQEVIPGLYLGPYAAAKKSENLYKHNISHIVCIRHSVEAPYIRPQFPELFRYLVLDVSDTVTENIITSFPKVRDFINEGYRTGGGTLVHGNAGISRSAALVIAFIMEKFSMTYESAFTHVQSKRFCINLNDGFIRQLTEYEPIYKAQMTLENGQTSQKKRSLKRKHTEDDLDTMDIDT